MTDDRDPSSRPPHVDDPAGYDASRHDPRADRRPFPDARDDSRRERGERDPEAGQHLIWVLLAAAIMLIVWWW